jgi:hypothetical protein
MEEKSKTQKAVSIIGLCLFWAVWFYGMMGFLVSTRFPDVLKDGLYMVSTGNTPSVGK